LAHGAVRSPVPTLFVVVCWVALAQCFHKSGHVLVLVLGIVWMPHVVSSIPWSCLAAMNSSQADAPHTSRKSEVGGLRLPTSCTWSILEHLGAVDQWSNGQQHASVAPRRSRRSEVGGPPTSDFLHLEHLGASWSGGPMDQLTATCFCGPPTEVGSRRSEGLRLPTSELCVAG